jgi:drug/metabolite transporter (DMT)-like permease
MKKDLLAYSALTAICLIWGTTYMALRIAVLHFPPFLFVTIRQLIAGALLIGIIMLTQKVAWPGIRDIRYQAVAGFFLITIGNGLVAWAEVHIPSGIAAMICSLVPLVVIMINLTVNREERPNIPIVVGIGLGFAGISMIFGGEVSQFANGSYLLGMIVTFIAVIGWAGGSVWIKKRKTQTNLFMNVGLQMFFGGVWMIPFSLAFDDLSAVRWSAEAGYALVYLIVFGSVIAFTCYTYALRNLPMTIVSLYAYVNPIVAVILGWLVLDEKLTATMGIAIMITVAGIYIVNRGYQLRNQWKAQLTPDG